MYDIILRNATIYDGSGSPSRQADISIKDGFIHEIGDIGVAEASRTVLDVGGLAVSPGFIDADNHSDTHWRMFSDPKLESLVRQGITTIVGGACGSSLAPLLRDRAIDSIRKWVDIRGININWQSMGDMLVHLSARGLPINFATLVGHSTLRRALVGDEHRALSDNELAQMTRALEEALSQGAMGISFGLAYSHAKAAERQELLSCMQVVAKHRGISAFHLRNEGALVDQSIEEACSLAQESNAKLHLLHLKIMGRGNWKQIDTVFEEIDLMAQKGMSLSFDVFPYDFTGTVLYTMLPDWVSRGGRDSMLQRLRDLSTKRQVVAEMQQGGIEYERVHILSATFLDRSMTKKSIADIAKVRGITPEEAVIEVLLSSEGRAIARMNVLSEAHVRRAMEHPLSMISSDGSGYSADHKHIGEAVHPRCFGAFPRFLGHYVRDQHILPLEQAIYKITGFPANRFGLEKRGLLREGYRADIVVFDPERIRDTATIRDPYRYPKGIEHVIVNGEGVIVNGEYVAYNAGMVIRS